MNELKRKLEEAFGKGASLDPQVLRSYDHDLGEMPALILRQLRTRPDAVVVARTVEDVAATLRIASQLAVPVTPRGQGSSGYGGALPTRGGILLDLSSLNAVLASDAEARTVDVQPGVVWEDLSRTLSKRGLDVGACPTSAPSSTVGGWFAMGGVGIGSLRHGSIRDAVLEIDVVGLDGQVTTLSGNDLDLHCQTCGILGVVTRLRIACRQREELRSFAVHLPEAAQVPALQSAAERELGAHSLSLQSAGYLKLRARLEPDGSPPIDDGFLALITLPAAAGAEQLEKAAAACGGRLLEPALAAHEWEERFYPMRIKRLGPSLLASEFLIPSDRFAETWRAVVRGQRTRSPALEACGARGGRLAVLVYALDDASHWLYPLRLAGALAPVRAALRHGGTIYSPGLWFASGAKRLFGTPRYRAVVAAKRRLDPKGLLNPDKVLRPRLRWLPFVDVSRLIALGSALASPISRRLSPPPPREG